MSKDPGFGELRVKPKPLIWFASDMNILTLSEWKGAGGAK